MQYFIFCLCLISSQIFSETLNQIIISHDSSVSSSNELVIQYQVKRPERMINELSSFIGKPFSNESVQTVENILQKHLPTVSFNKNENRPQGILTFYQKKKKLVDPERMIQGIILTSKNDEEITDFKKGSIFTHHFYSKNMNRLYVNLEPFLFTEFTETTLSEIEHLLINQYSIKNQKYVKIKAEELDKNQILKIIVQEEKIPTDRELQRSNF